MKLNISLGQMDVALGQPKKNLATVRQMTAEAARRGSEVVLFPELWATGYDLGQVDQHATELDEGIFAEVAGLAEEHSIHIVGTLMAVKGDGHSNTAVIFNPRGELAGEYSKVHLFELMDEPQHFVPGQRAPVFDLPWGLSALAICYDLRFPELFGKYAVMGATIVFLPAEWPYPRLMHWQALLRARAIENQFFVVACNRVGQSGDWTFFGHSSVYGPSGDLIVEGGDEEALLTTIIDLDAVDETRQLFNALEDRREEVYRSQPQGNRQWGG